MEDVSFSYAEEGHSGTGVEGISLSLGRGEVALLCGPSGCGKTTVTRLADGRASPRISTKEQKPAPCVCAASILRMRSFWETARLAGRRLSEPQNPVL